MPEPLVVAQVEPSTADPLVLLPAMSNRHGLVAGATGTGKTVTLQVMAEAFSRIGVPVFAADVKGDLSGISEPGSANPKFNARLQRLQLSGFQLEPAPVTLWDVFGQQGHPIRATISEMGPLLLSRILNLNDIQSGVLTLVFKIADDNGLLLLDIKDLQAILQYVGDKLLHLSNAVRQHLLRLHRRHPARPRLARRTGRRPVLRRARPRHRRPPPDARTAAASSTSSPPTSLMQSPQLYATFLLWLLSELFEHLPEAGDLDKPKLVFFFDEAHLLFTDLHRRPQVTHRAGRPPHPLQGRRHLLRHAKSHRHPRHRPRPARQPRPARPPRLHPARPEGRQVRRRHLPPQSRPRHRQVITELEVGEALVSFLDEKGTPGIVQRALIYPPHGQIGPITPEQRKTLMASSLVAGVYDTPVDRESAYERIKNRAAASPTPDTTSNPTWEPPQPWIPPAAQSQSAAVPSVQAGQGSTSYQQAPQSPPPQNSGGAQNPFPPPASSQPNPQPGASVASSILGGLTSLIAGTTGPRGGHHEGLAEVMMKSAARSTGTAISRQIVRGVLGSILGGSRR